MKPKLLSVLVASLFVPALAQGQQPQKEVTGSVSIGVRQVSNNTNDPSKFTEYRDLPDGTSAFAGIELRQRGDNNYMNIYGENIGRDDQYLNLDGGRYGTYKYRIYSDSLRHNFGSGPGARTPYFGAGGTTLTFGGANTPNQSPPTWNTFDHSYKRLNQGGFFELQATSPWYFRVDANEVKRDGMNVMAGARGTSPGGGFMDLPVPIDYTARNLSGEVGFANRRSHFAVNLMRSTFDNGNQLLRWQNDNMNPAGGILDTTVLPPSNELTRLALNGNIRGLGMDSTLAGRYTYTTLTSDVAVQQNMLNATTPAGGAFPATNPSDANFRGEHKRQTLGLSLASRPTRQLDTRVYYNYDKLKNDSTEISFNPAAGQLRAGANTPNVNCNSGAVSASNPTGVVNPCTPELFHYTKQNIGLEGGYRVGRESKVLAGVDWAHTDRERVDFKTTKETKVFGEYKAALTDALSGRIKYQYLQRRSDFDVDRSVTDANPMDAFVRRFDLANANQHLLKLVLDHNLPNSVDLGFEMILKQNKYPDTPLGRTKDDRQEFYGSFGWGDPNKLRLLVFGDVEFVNYDSSHRVGNQNPDPAAGPIAPAGTGTATYNWTAKNQDKSWQVGVGADWAARPRLKLKTSLLYAETNGEATFNASPPAGTVPATTPITNFDNTKRFSLVLKGVYEMTKALELTGGYAYENYKYSDIGYDNTRYIVPPAGANASYVTGQFSFQPYSANILFAMAKVKF